MKPDAITPIRQMGPKPSVGSWNAQLGAMRWTLDAANSVKTKRSRKAQRMPPPSPDELAAFYAAKVNSDEHLPASMISAAMCGLMLERGLVTPEHLRMRGVR